MATGPRRWTADEVRAVCQRGERDFRRGDLSGPDLRDADLRGADFRGTNLRGAYLKGCELGPKLRWWMAQRAIGTPVGLVTGGLNLVASMELALSPRGVLQGHENTETCKTPMPGFGSLEKPAGYHAHNIAKLDLSEAQLGTETSWRCVRMTTSSTPTNGLASSASPQALPASLQLDELRDPSERVLFVLMICMEATFVLAAIAICVATGVLGEALWLVLTTLVPIAVMSWVSWRFAYWVVHGNSIKVSAAYSKEMRRNPSSTGLLADVYGVVEQACVVLNIKQTPSLFIMQGDGLLELFIAKRFSRRGMIIITSNLLDDLLESGDTRRFMMIVGRQLGHIASGHFRWWVFTDVLSFLAPMVAPAYHRCCQYTADRVGLMLCGDLQSAQGALLVLTVGKRSAPGVSMELLKEQRDELNESLAAFVHHMFQKSPRMIERIVALSEFHHQRLCAHRSATARIAHVVFNHAKIGVQVIGDSAVIVGQHHAGAD